MFKIRSGSIRLFRLFGIDVYLHWWWFLAAAYEVTARSGSYGSIGWNIAEYVALFAVITMHEYGHALACRQTGGQPHDIILWPFGGIAFVSTPQRAGATLWSVVAGPLVNLVLIPIFALCYLAAYALGLTAPHPDLAHFLLAMVQLNVWLLIFNLMPIFPLDGGQILRSLLWFKFGRVQSLRIASVIGMIVLPLAVLWKITNGGDVMWTIIIAVFIGQYCWSGLRQAKSIEVLEAMPRHGDVACPTCHSAPPGGPLWRCRQCGSPFDPFSTNAVCPHCQAAHPKTTCVYCGAAHPIDQWRTNVPPTL